ncbi:MAG: hypothetical protein RL693_1119 [Verrucomicrobiota bacterium]|jgi:hypothetical protein
MCVLKIYSQTTSFKDNAALKRLPVYSIHEKGDVRRKRTGELHDKYRVSLDVSDAEWDELSLQTADAVEFLSTNRKALSDLLRCSDDTEAFLDFPLWSRLSGEIVNQNDHIPKKLIALAGELGLGIEMSIYAQDAFDGLGESAPETTLAEQDGGGQPATRPESK